MPYELSTSTGKRKYLTSEEVQRFLKICSEHERAEVRTLCMTLAYTGCRITEALELTADRVDFSAKTLTFRTLKQRDKVRYRSIPVPLTLLDAIDLTHGVRKAKRRKGKGKTTKLWSWGRSRASALIAQMMTAADIEGLHASPKGLRHAFGLNAATKTRNPRLVQKWMGHEYLETTMIYMDAIGEEERELAERMW